MSNCPYCCFGESLCPKHCPVEETKTEAAARTTREAGIPVAEIVLETREAVQIGLPGN